MKQLINLTMAMTTLFLFFGALPVQAAIPTNLANEFVNLPCMPSQNGDLTITGGSANLNLSLGTLRGYKGSITSLKVNGTETVNTYNDGRMIQYAFQVNNHWELENPTEAVFDSRFIEGCANGNKLYTKSQMGYWMLAYDQMLSPYVLSKIVQVGVGTMPNLVRIVAKLHVSDISDILNIEAPAGHINKSFSNLSTFDLPTYIVRQVTPDEFDLNYAEGITHHFSSPVNPIIISNGQYSLVPYIASGSTGYVYLRGSDTNKLRYMLDPNNTDNEVSKFSAITKVENAQPGDYYFETYLLVTPNSLVKQDIIKMLTQIPPDNYIPIGILDKITSSGEIKGWAADRDSEQIDVHLYLDGSIFIGATSTTKVRQDVFTIYGYGMSSGFSFQIPTKFLTDGKNHTISGYIIDKKRDNTLSGNNQLLDKSGISIPPYIPHSGDLNSDGKVDIFDYNILIGDFGKTGSNGFIPSDIDSNGKVDIFDFNILLGNFGK